MVLVRLVISPDFLLLFISCLIHWDHLGFRTQLVKNFWWIERSTDQSVPSQMIQRRRWRREEDGWSKEFYGERIYISPNKGWRSALLWTVSLVSCGTSCGCVWLKMMVGVNDVTQVSLLLLRKTKWEVNWISSSCSSQDLVLIMRAHRENQNQGFL